VALKVSMHRQRLLDLLVRYLAQHPEERERVVDGLDHVGPGQDQQVVVALEILGMVCEALAAIVGLGKPVRLEHRTGCAVEEQNALREELLELVSCVSGHGSGLASRWGVSVVASPSRVVRLIHQYI
jgi:hypothetical protein